MNFSNLDKVELKKYIDFMMYQYRIVDAFWFIYVEEEHGLKAAEHINEQVWTKVAKLAARDIKERFKIEEKGLRGFVRAFGFFPWANIIDYQIEEKGDEVIFSVPHCPPQEARIRKGMGEFACRDMHFAEFSSFAKEIDERIKVECLFAPPGNHPEDMFCKWRFTCTR
nr:hypothetical protein [Desulfobacterales bacterium]